VSIGLMNLVTAAAWNKVLNLCFGTGLKDCWRFCKNGLEPSFHSRRTHVINSYYTLLYIYIYNIHIQMTQPAQLGILQNTKFIEPTTYERHTIRYIYIHRYACFPMFGGWHIACNGGEVFIGATKKGTKPGSVVSLKRCARNTANCWLLVPDISRYCLYIHAYSIPTPELSLNDICALWEGLKAPMIGFCWQICKKHRNRNTKDGGL
jgi:hypothetical protein